MATYTVELYRTVTETATVTVDATLDTAGQIALDRADELNWKHVGVESTDVEDVILEEG